MIHARLTAAAAALLCFGSLVLVAGPAVADTSTSSSLAMCTPAPSAPLYTDKCAPKVMPGASFLVTVPGVGTLTFKVTPQGTVDPSTPPTAVAENMSNFTAGDAVVSADGTHITVTFFNAKEPEQAYTLKVRLTPPTSNGAQPTVKAVLKPAGEDHEQSDDDDDNGNGKQEKDKADENEGGGGPAAQLSGTHGHHSEGASGSSGDNHQGNQQQGGDGGGD